MSCSSALVRSLVCVTVSPGAITQCGVGYHSANCSNGLCGSPYYVSHDTWKVGGHWPCDYQLTNRQLTTLYGIIAGSLAAKFNRARLNAYWILLIL